MTAAEREDPGQEPGVSEQVRSALPDSPREWAHLIGFVALIAIVLPFLIFAVPQLVGAEQSYVVLSGSMEPAISPGDVIIVNEVPASAIAVGDVITYGDGQAAPPTTHRVVGVEQTNDGVVFETKGDANENVDIRTVEPADLRGRVMTLPVAIPGNGHKLFVIPAIGYVSQFIDTPLGFLLLVGVPLFLLSISEFRAFASADSTDTQADAAPPVEQEPTEADPEAESVFVLTQTVLSVALAGFALLAGFAAQNAIESRSALAATVAAGAGVGALLLLTILVNGDEATTADPVEQLPSDGPGRETVVVGHIPEPLLERPQANGETAADLVARATEQGECVIYDPDREQYVLFTGEQVHTATPASQSEPAARGATPDQPATDAPDHEVSS
jgi:signal peptidase